MVYFWCFCCTKLTYVMLSKNTLTALSLCRDYFKYINMKTIVSLLPLTFLLPFFCITSVNFIIIITR